MDLFAQAARLNNEGVTFLVEGDDKMAVESLTKSIKLMKQELSKPGVDIKAYKAEALEELANEHSTVELPGFHEAQESGIFSEALTIPENGDSSEQDIHVYSAAVIFNLALAHHRSGRRGDAAHLVKAEKLYGMILKLLVECVNRTAVIVKLASINNLAQIRFESGDYELAREGLDHLSSFMRNTEKSNQAVLEEPEIQGLVMNVLLLKAPRVAPAA